MKNSSDITITRDLILHIANLSMIKLSDESVERMEKDLTSIMSYISQLFELDVDDVEETSQVTGLKNVFRDDGITNEFGEEIRDKLLKNAPKTRDGYVQVPRVLH